VIRFHVSSHSVTPGRYVVEVLLGDQLIATITGDDEPAGDRRGIRVISKYPMKWHRESFSTKPHTVMTIQFGEVAHDG
jgi:hypothetical protein